MSPVKLLFGALSIAGLGFGAGYYCAIDWSPAYAEAPAPAPASETLEQQLALAAAIDDYRRLQAQAGTQPGNPPSRDFPNVPIQEQKSYAALMDKLDRLPESLIKSQLEKYLGRESIEKIGDIRAFSKRLLEVALDDQDKPPAEDDPEDNNNPVQVNIQFSKSPMYGNRMVLQDVAVTKFEPLFAHMVTADEVGEVIVKWQDLSTGEILLFDKMNLGPGSQPYISATPAGGWRNSLYRVSISSMDQSVQLMATNTINISEVHDGVDGPNQEIIDELVSMGQAVPKKSVK